MAILTEEEFRKHLGTVFNAATGESEIELTLVEVESYNPGPKEQSNMERFSAFFEGPRDPFVPQQNLHVHHPEMGEFDIFLVPVRGDDKGFRYEAVFNFYR